jgi:type II secretory pathway component PulK
MGNRTLHNDRGVALLIVLLVTALLVALVFEFAYGTRVSLRAAVNFRNSQRAYYLARSGVNFAGRILSDNLKNNKLQDNLKQQEWMIVPVVSGGDTELRVRWDDECGKINIGTSFYNNSLTWFRQLLEDSGITQNVVDRIRDEKNNRINLVTELHQFLSDEEFTKVENSLTVLSDGKIDINTASEKVVQSVFKENANSVLMSRNNGPLISLADANNTNINKPTLYSTTSDYFKIYSHATVGEYTRQVEAVIRRSSAGFIVLYWRSL